MTKINSKLMIDYDDNNSYLDFITEKEIKYHIKSIKEYRNGYSITFIIKDTVKPVSIQQKLDDNVIKYWEYSEEIRESLGIDKAFIDDCIADLISTSKYWLAINIIEEEIREYIEVEFASSRISYKEYDRKLDVEYEDDDITHAIENIEYMIEKEYGENATLAEIKQESEYHYNLLIASTYLKTKTN
jgi:hypothetical protein